MPKQVSYPLFSSGPCEQNMMGSRYYLLQRQCFQWQEFTGFLLFLKVKAETQVYLVRKIHRQKQIKVITRNS